MEDNRQLLDPVLSAENDNGFKRLKTVPVFSIHLLISSAISLTGVILAATWTDSKRCDAYFIMLYLRAAFWIITFIFDHIVKVHHDKLKLNGYHDFHRATSVHKGVPLYIVSLWNTALLALQSLIHHYYGDDFGIKCLQSYLSPIVYVTIFSCVETIILAAVNGSYIVKVVKFNRAQLQPDALRGTHSAPSVGLTQRGGDMAELLEKQADLINYLKDHNLKLNQKLMQLNSEVRTVRFPQNP